MLAANKQLISSDKDKDNNKGTIIETKEVISTDKKFVNVMKKLDMS